MHIAKPHASSVSPNLGASRMSLSNVTRGKQERPLRVILYGVEGVGKSTFAASAPAPIFLCSEDGTSQLDVARFPTPRTWAEALEAVRVLTHEEHAFKSLVIDTLDWLEPLCWQAVCQTSGKQNIEEFGYGKGYLAAVDQWRSLLTKLDALVRTRKMHVLLIAHGAVKRVDDPQTGPFDRYRMKVHEKSADLLREWVDAILFARHEVMTVERKGKMRGVSSGARVMHTQWTAAYDAKNRFDLPETMPLDWDEFELAVRSHTPADVDQMKEELSELIPRLNDQSKAEKAMREWAGDNPARLAQLLDKVRGKVAIESRGLESHESGEMMGEALAHEVAVPHRDGAATMTGRRPRRGANCPLSINILRQTDRLSSEHRERPPPRVNARGTMNERPEPQRREVRHWAAGHRGSEHTGRSRLEQQRRSRLAPGLLASLLTLILATPASAFAMSIDDAIRLALKGNERARIAELRIEQASGSLERTRASFLPQLTFGANTQLRGYEDRAGNRWSHAATLTATQPLIAPSAYMQYSQAEHTLKAEQSNAVELQRSLSFDTARAFVLVLANQQVLTAAERRLDRARANLQNSEARASAQLTSTNDATKSKIDVASAAQSVATSTSALQRTKNQLALLIGAEEVGELDQPDSLISAATSFQGDTSNLIANAIDNRPDIRVLREQVQAAQASAKEPNYRLIPSLSLMGQIRANPLPLSNERWHDEVLQLSLNWALFDGGARYGDRRTRLAQAESVEMELRLARRGVGTGVKAAMAALMAAREAVIAAELSVEAARQNSDETAILYRQGLAKAIEVTDANARGFDAEVGLASAKLTLAQSYLELRQAMGLFPSDNVGPTVERRGEESGQ